jgi:hypothetical protein
VADLADLRFSLWVKIFIFWSKNFFLKNFQILLFGQKIKILDHSGNLKFAKNPSFSLLLTILGAVHK